MSNKNREKTQTLNNDDDDEDESMCEGINEHSRNYVVYICRMISI
jgi:hypothetical protein